ncbi:MAG: hypothetical protein ABJQ29_02150 [Luteolibacter sp.]
MKISIAIAAVILALTAAIGWNDHLTLEIIAEKHRLLTEEAAALGVFVDPEGTKGEVLVTKREREDKDAEARQAARDFIAFALELEALEKTGEEGGEEMQKRISEFMERMLSLDVGQLKILIAEFRANTEMKDETRSGMIAFAIMTLASDNPQAALTVFTESGDLLEDEMFGEHVLSSSLAKWAATDPEAALDWIRENGKKNPDLITDDVKSGLVEGAATLGMATGFDLLKELKLEDPSDALVELAGVARTAGERTEFLKLLRDFSNTVPGSEQGSYMGTLSALGDGIAKDGFDTGSEWITGNDLSEKEIADVSISIFNHAKPEDKGKWIEWMGENLPEAVKVNRISNSMRSWTESDYRAAGEWLVQAPEGPVKREATSSYATTVAPYDPGTAVQWAMTLPAGNGRQETLKGIYQKWPTKTPEDKTSRAAFAAEHGFK